jgi:hypothetical protein
MIEARWDIRALSWESMKRKGFVENSLIPRIIKENRSKVLVKVFHTLECFNKRAY